VGLERPHCSVEFSCGLAEPRRRVGFLPELECKDRLLPSGKRTRPSISDQRNIQCDANAHSYCYRYVDADSYCHSNGDADANANSYCHSNADADANADGNCHSDIYTYDNPYSNVHSDSHSDIHAYGHSHVYPYSYSHGYSDIHADGDPHGNHDATTAAYAYAEAISNASAAPDESII
jgi:hypothetical protein